MDEFILTSTYTAAFLDISFSKVSRRCFWKNLIFFKVCVCIQMPMEAIDLRAPYSCSSGKFWAAWCGCWEASPGSLEGQAVCALNYWVVSPAAGDGFYFNVITWRLTFFSENPRVFSSLTEVLLTVFTLAWYYYHTTDGLDGEHLNFMFPQNLEQWLAHSRSPELV